MVATTDRDSAYGVAIASFGTVAGQLMSTFGRDRPADNSHDKTQSAVSQAAKKLVEVDPG